MAQATVKRRRVRAARAQLPGGPYLLLVPAMIALALVSLWPL